MERYVKITNNNYYDAVSNKIIVTDKKIGGSIPKKMYSFIPLFDNQFLHNNLNNSRQQLILSVTEQCNFRCQYCIYCDTKFQNSKKNTELKKMNFDVAKKAIDEFLSNSLSSERRCISFYGGEALLNFDLIEKCVGYVESLNLTSEITFLITTNGTLINEDIANFLYEHRFLVNISMDGPQETHDRYRKTINGDDSFEKIIKATKTLIMLDPKYWKNSLSFLCVLAPPINMEALINYFELLPYNYSLSDLEFTDTMKSILKRDAVQSEYNENQDEIYFENRKRASTGLEIEIRTTKEILQRSYLSPFVPGKYCIPILKRTYVSVDGNYYICEKDDQNDDHIIGNVNTGVDHDRIIEIRDEVLEFHTKNCKKCWAARFCGMCFATLNKFPDCCEEYKRNTLNALKHVVEENENERF